MEELAHTWGNFERFRQLVELGAVPTDEVLADRIKWITILKRLVLEREGARAVRYMECIGEDEKVVDYIMRCKAGKL